MPWSEHYRNLVRTNPSTSHKFYKPKDYLPISPECEQLETYEIFAFPSLLMSRYLMYLPYEIRLRLSADCSDASYIDPGLPRTT